LEKAHNQEPERKCEENKKLQRNDDDDDQRRRELERQAYGNNTQTFRSAGKRPTGGAQFQPGRQEKTTG
jgi:hypothetical protein